MKRRDNSDSLLIFKRLLVSLKLTYRFLHESSSLQVRRLFAGLAAANHSTAQLDI